MKSLMRVVIAGVILTVVSNCAVGALVSGLYDTGVDGIGPADLHYTLVSVPDPTSPYTTAIGIDCSGTAWVPAPAGCSWIAPTCFGTAIDPVADPLGDYVYELIITTLPGVDPSEIVIKGDWAADNRATMSLNSGAPIASRAVPGHFTLESFEVTGLNAGSNTLEFTVTNTDGGGWNPTGLLVMNLVETPEPATVLLLGLGGLSLVRRRRGR